ncbi:MAG: hypothetical protein E7255_15000 [Lachnospiraceae bacterium]|jgi:hypothetical protein|nr:hypothetical protein [Lachnospiraceae bacterium]
MRREKLFKSILLGAALTVFAGTTAFAAIDIDGGKWDYGYKNLYFTVYSRYYHETSIHGSSVDGAWFDSDYNVAKDVWSNASADAAVSGNHCYYCLGERNAVNGLKMPDVPIDVVQ